MTSRTKSWPNQAMSVGTAFKCLGHVTMLHSNYSNSRASGIQSGAATPDFDLWYSVLTAWTGSILSLEGYSSTEADEVMTTIKE